MRSQKDLQQSSQMVHQVTDRRNRLQDDIVEAVECLKSWAGSEN